MACSRSAARSCVAAASGTHPAFSASYDLVTDESGATKRLSLSITLAERDRQLSIARDEAVGVFVASTCGHRILLDLSGGLRANKEAPLALFFYFRSSGLILTIRFFFLPNISYLNFFTMLLNIRMSYSRLTHCMTCEQGFAIVVPEVQNAT